MDNRRTPTQPRPIGSQQKSTGSNSKLARLRSQRKQDGNATLCGGFRSPYLSVRGSSRNLNQTVRENLDSASSSAGQPTIKSSLGLPVPDNDKEYNVAYNDYLLALAKQQLVKKNIDHHKAILKGQIVLESEHLYQLESTFKNISNQIKSLVEQSYVVELLQMLECGASEIKQLCSRYNTYSCLGELDKVLEKESELFSVRNIKTINSQEEYENLMATLYHLKCVLQKIIQEDKKINEVNGLSEYIKLFKELNCTITQRMNKLSESNKGAVSLFLKQASDFFARQGGYF